MTIRLNKLMASRGIAARRRCDVLIAEGRVRVNGRVVNEPGTMVDAEHDRIEVEGRPLPRAQALVYYVLNKPVGVITTMDDPEGRRTVRELLPRGTRVYPVGRLDADTSGLLLLTNDGELAHKLMHPRYGVVKVYRVRLEREPSRGQLERLARGVEFEPGATSAPAKVRRIDPGFDAIMIEVQIHEGRFRQVRRMCEAVGLHVTGLHRVGYGPLRLGPLARGLYRELSEDEVTRLRAAGARPGGTGPPSATPWRTTPAREKRAAKPPRASVPPAVEPDDDADVEETWIPGGGFVPAPEADEKRRDDRPVDWPARPDGRRGDEGFKRERGAPAPIARASEPQHAERGPRARVERASRPRVERTPSPRVERASQPRFDRTSRPRTERQRAEQTSRTSRARPESRPVRSGARPDARGGRPLPMGRREARGRVTEARPGRARPTARPDERRRGPDARPGRARPFARTDARRAGPDARSGRSRPAGRTDDRRRGTESRTRDARPGAGRGPRDVGGGRREARGLSPDGRRGRGSSRSTARPGSAGAGRGRRSGPAPKALGRRRPR